MSRTVACITATIGLGVGAAASPGLTVDEEGVLLRDGAPYRGFGVNYFDAFMRVILDPDDNAYEEGFAVLAEHGIPFARVNFGGFWPVQWELYLEDRDAYFARMDAFVASAEAHGLGLIPSLFWYHGCVPDIVGEPVSAWGDKDSKTHAFMKEYVEAVVTRYRDARAIWAWEFGNEYNLAADLPNAEEHRPMTAPRLGTPESRGPEDDLTHAMVITAAKAFAEAVRRHDPHRVITTGHSIPRPSAEHMRRGEGWSQDSEAEYRKNLVDITPDPHNLASIRLYPDHIEDRFGRETLTYGELLAISLDAAANAGKALFVGEFGAPSPPSADAGKVRENHAAMIQAMMNSGVPLAAAWVFDLPQQEDEGWNFTPQNERAYILEKLQAANERLAAEGRSARPPS